MNPEIIYTNFRDEALARMFSADEYNTFVAMPFRGRFSYDPDSILKTIKEIWMYKKNTQPLSTKNSGCVFKNPRGLSAGALIDRAGLKGLPVGGAQISEEHANFIIANKGCKSQDIEKLIKLVQDRVVEQFDVNLELELEIW